MSKIAKRAPTPSTVVVDTNVLWTEDKSYPANPQFDNFWEQHSAIVELELLVPDVVRSELLYQQTTAALKALSKADEHLRRVSEIASSSHTHKISTATLHSQIVKKLDRWLKQKKAKIIPVPHASINWQILIDAALWRKPPFTADPKNPDTEKGFRDALILESLVAHVLAEKRDFHIAFACKDRLLRDTAKKRIADTRFAGYESLEALSTYLKLAHEQLTDAFIKAILKKAATKFYKVDDQGSLFLREKLTLRVHEDAKPLLANPLSIAPLAGIALSGFTSESWTPNGVGKTWLTAPQFVRLDGDREYHWKTGITTIWPYQSAVAPWQGLTLSPPAPPQRRFLFAFYDAAWHANVKSDGRFHDVTFDSLERTRAEFRACSDEEIIRYNLGSNT